MWWSGDGTRWQQAGPAYDASRLSDEFPSEGHFTGTVVGVLGVDLMHHSFTSDWHDLTYQPTASMRGLPA